MTKTETPMSMNTCTWQQSQNIPSNIRDATGVSSACFRKVPASRQQTCMNFLRRPTRSVACGSHCELLPREVALHVRARHKSASDTNKPKMNLKRAEVLNEVQLSRRMSTHDMGSCLCEPAPQILRTEFNGCDKF